jgi:hypothetical protein
MAEPLEQGIADRHIERYELTGGEPFADAGANLLDGCFARGSRGVKLGKAQQLCRELTRWFGTNDEPVSPRVVANGVWRQHVHSSHEPLYSARMKREKKGFVAIISFAAGAA